MSFPKAAIKRFNENGGCAPPPGHYLLAEKEKSVGVLKFENYTDRFKNDSVTDGSSDVFAVPSNPSSSKKKLNFNGSSSLKLNGDKKESKTPTVKASPRVVNKEKQAFEREIRQLLQQCNDREKDLNNTRQEVTKLEGKVTSLTKEKLSLKNEISVAEKNVVALQKKNEFLLAKEAKEKRKENIELEVKRSRTQMLALKQQLERDRVRMQNLEADLAAAKARIVALQQANTVLEKLNQEIEQHGDDVCQQVTALQGVADQLRAENARLQDQLHCSDAKLRTCESRFAQTMKTAVEATVVEYEDKLAVLKDSLDNQVERLQAANDRIHKLSPVLSNFEDTRKSLEEEKHSLQQELESFKLEHVDCHGIHRKVEADLTTYKEKLREAQSLVEELRADSENTKTEHYRFSQERDAELKTLKEELENVASSFESEREQRASLDERLTEYSETNKALQREVGELSHSRDELKTNLNKAEIEIEKLSSKDSDNSSQLSYLEAENNALHDRMSEMVTELSQRKADLTAVEESVDAMRLDAEKSKYLAQERLENERSLQTTIDMLKQTADEAQSANQAKLNEFTRRILETQKKLNQRDSDLKSAKEDIQRARSELQERDNLHQKVLTEQKQQINKLLTNNAQLQEKLTTTEISLEELSTRPAPEMDESEIIRWKSLYEELLEKVKPFQSQLDAYSHEKSMLMCETSAAQAELSQLGKKYAELLGHQNQKQKIRHVVKIKEENLGLKQENMKLKNQVSSLQRQVIEGRKTKLDPTKAFNNQKENTNPNK